MHMSCFRILEDTREFNYKNDLLFPIFICNWADEWWDLTVVFNALRLNTQILSKENGIKFVQLEKKEWVDAMWTCHIIRVWSTNLWPLGMLVEGWNCSFLKLPGLNWDPKNFQGGIELLQKLPGCNCYLTLTLNHLYAVFLHYPN